MQLWTPWWAPYLRNFELPVSWMAVVTANGTRFTNGFIAKIYSANYLHIRWPQAIDCGDMRGQHRCQICSFKHICLFHGAPDAFSRTLAIPAIGNLFGVTDFHLFSSNGECHEFEWNCRPLCSSNKRLVAKVIPALQRGQITNSKFTISRITIL